MNNKIGIDFHGVIDAQPELFAVFCREVRQRGIAVYVISGGPEEDVARCLAEHHIEYDGLWAIYDYYKAQGKVIQFEGGGFQVPTDLWNTAKAEYCAREGIDFHIDDSPVYGKYFMTPYCHYDMGEDTCALHDGVKVDFKNPSEAARLVAEYIQSS